MLLPLLVNRMDVFFTREDFFILFIFLQAKLQGDTYISFLSDPFLSSKIK